MVANVPNQRYAAKPADKYPVDVRFQRVRVDDVDRLGTDERSDFESVRKDLKNQSNL